MLNLSYMCVTSDRPMFETELTRGFATALILQGSSVFLF